MRILVAHDGSSQAAEALDLALRVLGQSGGEIDIVTVVPDLCLATEELSTEECEMVANSLATEARGQMRKVSESLEAKGLKAEIIIKTGRPADGIVEAARELRSDLIVIGRHGKHGARKHLGSVASRVAEMADVNTLLVK